MLPTVILYTASLTSASFLWFGIFVITRRRITPQTAWWQDSLIFTGIAAVLAAVYKVVQMLSDTGFVGKFTSIATTRGTMA